MLGLGVGCWEHRSFLAFGFQRKYLFFKGTQSLLESPAKNVVWKSLDFSIEERSSFFK